MKTIGLTGGIGSGKSTVSQILAGLGAWVIDADKVGHEIYLPGKAAWQQVTAAFGPDILATDQTIDRKKLGAIVFGSDEARKKLNAIVHPLMCKEIGRRIKEKRAEGVIQPIVVEAAVLIEANWLPLVDEVWVVVAGRSAVIERVATQRGLSAHDTEARIVSQLADAERLKHASVVIPNDGALEKLFPPGYHDPTATLKRIVDSRMNEWMRRYHHDTAAIPGSIELLHDLHARGLRLGIATSSGRALPFLDRWGVRRLFSGIVGREDVETRKPHPEPVLKCLGHLGLDPHEVAYIGDSPIDIRAGKAAGSYTVGVLTGTSPRDVLHVEGPDHILESVAGLCKILHL